jgi:Arc/MetJ family transcription regulator
MHEVGMIVNMRRTINLDNRLMAEAAQLTGITGKTALLHKALEALIAVEAGRRLAALGGSDKSASAGRRHRSRPGA